MSAKIIPLFPQDKRSCFSCDNAYLGVGGVICEVTRDFVFDERIASDCEMFETGRDNDAI